MHCNQLGCSDFPLSLANNLKPEIVPRLNAHIAIVRSSYWMTMLIAFFLLLHNTKNFDHSIEIAFLFRSALLFHSKDFVHTRYERMKKVSTPKTNMKSENVQTIGCCGSDENEKKNKISRDGCRNEYYMCDGGKKIRKID